HMYASIIDQTVDPAGLLHDRLHGCMNTGLVSDIKLQHFYLDLVVCNLGIELLSAAQVAHGSIDLKVTLSEIHRCRQPNARRSARNQHRILCHGCFSTRYCALHSYTARILLYSFSTSPTEVSGGKNQVSNASMRRLINSGLSRMTR